MAFFLDRVKGPLNMNPSFASAILSASAHPTPMDAIPITASDSAQSAQFNVVTRTLANNDIALVFGPQHLQELFQEVRLAPPRSSHVNVASTLLRPMTALLQHGDCFIHFLRDFLDQGIFNSDAHLWQLQRKTATYEFNTRSLQNFILDVVAFELRTRLLPILVAAAKSGRVLDLQDVLERFAFDNVCKVAFNVDPACLIDNGAADPEFMRAFEDVAALSSGRFMSVFPLVWKAKKLLNVGTERRLRESISTVRQFADVIIRSRLKSVTR
ncbi:hypothetical protein Fmac_032724 [Flemingia macrophylla]|uniref:Cytochrome P450 n=1 Tax=Flemingia macrophylla TaxID=520843 RepID=A0ABD1L657_9FABA